MVKATHKMPCAAFIAGPKNCMHAEQRLCPRLCIHALHTQHYHNSQTRHTCVQRLQPQPGHYRARDEVLGRLGKLLREAGGLWEVSRLHVEPYGSYLSGLFSLESDLDIAIEGDGPDG